MRVLKCQSRCLSFFFVRSKSSYCKWNAIFDVDHIHSLLCFAYTRTAAFDLYSVSNVSNFFTHSRFVCFLLLFLSSSYLIISKYRAHIPYCTRNAYFVMLLAIEWIAPHFSIHFFITSTHVLNLIRVCSLASKNWFAFFINLWSNERWYTFDYESQKKRQIWMHSE